jgi:hypothetical protein
MSNIRALGHGVNANFTRDGLPDYASRDYLYKKQVF